MRNEPKFKPLEDINPGSHWTIPYRDFSPDEGSFDSVLLEEVDGFTLNNENPSSIREMMEIAQKQMKLRRSSGLETALGIASGGECLLLGVLPYVPKVTGIDLGYSSIASTAIKAEFIRTHKTHELRRVLERGEKYFADLVDAELIHSIPADVVGRSLDSYKSIFTDHDSVKHTYLSEFNQFRFVWFSTPEEVFDRARENIMGLSLEHAPITSDREKHDIAYASNTCDRRWTGNFGFLQAPSLLVSNLTKEGYLLTSHSISLLRRPFTKLVAQVTEDFWTYSLYRKTF